MGNLKIPTLGVIAASLSATSESVDSSDAIRINQRCHEFALDCTVGASSSKAFTFTAPGIDYGAVITTEIGGYFGGSAGNFSSRQKRTSFYLFTNSMAANASATEIVTGTNASDLTITVAAVGTGNQFKVTIANANAGAFAGCVRFVVVSGTPYKLPVPV